MTTEVSHELERMDSAMSNKEEERSPFYLRILERQGLAVLLVVLTVYYLFFHLSPSAVTFLNEIWGWHRETVNKIVKNSEDQTGINKELSKNQEIIAKALDDNSKILKEVTEKQIPVLNRIDAGIQSLGAKVEKLEGMK